MSKGVIAVTGSNRGIGAAIAAGLAGKGYTVACLTRQGKTPQAELEAAKRLVGVTCDITDKASIESAMVEVLKIEGALKGLVNCAGISNSGASHEYALEDFEAMFKTNVLGGFAMCQAVYQPLCDAGGGLIVNIGSFWDHMGVKYFTAYCASKAAVAAVTRCLGVEWGKKGICVVDVAPGYIETDMTREGIKSEGTWKYLENRLPLGRVGQPEEIARTVAALFDANVGFLTATTIYVDGGQGPAQ